MIYKDWKSHIQITYNISHWDGPELRLVQLMKESRFSSSSFSLLNHKAMWFARGEAVRGLGKKNGFRHQSKIPNWKVTWGRSQGHCWAVTSFCPCVVIMTTMQKLSNMNTSKKQHRMTMLRVSFSSNQGSYNLYLGLMVDQYGRLHLQHKPWTNWENIILSIKADRIMSHSKWKVELVKLSV